MSRPKPVRSVVFLGAIALVAWGIGLERPGPWHEPAPWLPRIPAGDPAAGLPARDPGPRVPVVDTSAAAGESLPATLEPIRGQLIRDAAREWKYIVVHHSAGTQGNAASIDKMHREERGWDGLGYHFVVGNGNGAPLGGIEVGYRWVQQIHGAHAGSNEHNQHGIGICVVGNYDQTEFPEEAYGPLRDLTAWLAKRHGIGPDRILAHNAVRPDPTDCPGKNFPLDRLRRDVEALLRPGK